MKNTRSCLSILLWCVCMMLLLLSNVKEAKAEDVNSIMYAEFNCGKYAVDNNIVIAFLPDSIMPEEDSIYSALYTIESITCCKACLYIVSDEDFEADIYESPIRIYKRGDNYEKKD